MTNEERDLLTSFVQRISGAGAAPGSLPPLDPDAGHLITDLFARFPEASYRMTQTAFVQEAALAQAQSRIQQLQAALEQAQRTAQVAQNAPAKPSSFFGGLFGGGQPATPPVPTQPPAPQQANPWGQPAQPAYPQQPQFAPQQPGYPPQMMQQGPGFFGSALRTAAGVAGGVVLADTLMGMFSGSHMGGGLGGGGFGGAGFGGGGFGGAPAVNETTIINNYGDQSAIPTPPEPPAWGGQQDASWDPPSTDSSGWQDASSTDDSGFSGSSFDDSTDV